MILFVIQVEGCEENLEQNWADINQAAADRIAALQATISARKQLYTNIDAFNKRSDKLKKAVDATDHIYVDEIDDNRAKIQVGCFCHCCHSNTDS